MHKGRVSLSGGIKEEKKTRGDWSWLNWAVTAFPTRHQSGWGEEGLLFSRTSFVTQLLIISINDNVPRYTQELAAALLFHFQFAKSSFVFYYSTRQEIVPIAFCLSRKKDFQWKISAFVRQQVLFFLALFLIVINISRSGYLATIYNHKNNGPPSATSHNECLSLSVLVARTDE